MINTIPNNTQIITYNQDSDNYLKIAFEALWDNIPITKSYIENIMLIGTVSADDIHKIGTAASELLENAIKYSLKEGIKMAIKKLHNKNEVEITISNYTNQANADKALKRIEEIHQADSLEYYLFRMKESVKNKEKDAGLGLARVYHEASARIDASYDAKEQLIEVKVLITV